MNKNEDKNMNNQENDANLSDNCNSIAQRTDFDPNFLPNTESELTVTCDIVPQDLAHSSQFNESAQSGSYQNGEQNLAHSRVLSKNVTFSLKTAVILVVLVSILLVFAVISLCLQLFGGKKSEDLYKTAERSTVNIRAYDVSGSYTGMATGFFVSADGQIATSYHVIDNSMSFVAYLSDGSTYQITEILACDKAADLAIVKIEKTDCIPLKIASNLPEIGEKIYTLGNPYGYTNTFSEGIVSAVRNVNDIASIQFSAPISGGNSGGALLNAHGEVVGVVRSHDSQGNALAFATAANYLSRIRTFEGVEVGQFVRENGTDVSASLLYNVISGNAVVYGIKGNGFSGFIKIPSVVDGYPVKTIDFDEESSAKLSSVAHITIGEGIKIIANDSFCGATNLLSVTIPSSVEIIDVNAFSNCAINRVFLDENNKFFTKIDDILYNKAQTTLYLMENGSTATQFVAPDSLAYICNGAFYRNKNLVSVVLNDNLLFLGEAGSEDVYKGVFQECENLKSVEISQNAHLSTIGNRAFCGCKGLKSYDISINVNMIGQYAFAGCSNLTSLIVYGDNFPDAQGDILANSSFCSVYASKECQKSASFRNGWLLYLGRMKDIATLNDTQGNAKI